MKDPRTDHAEKVALFRYGLIADVLTPAPDETRKLYERLAEKQSGAGGDENLTLHRLVKMAKASASALTP